jgi:2-dehydro-3-deoxyglucarate aldolase
VNKLNSIQLIRNKLLAGEYSLGGWMQLADSSVAEIMGSAGYDWVAVDAEHGSFALTDMPNLFRALELGNTLPLVRVPDQNHKYCQQVLDAGAAGVIVPMIEDANSLASIIDTTRWPPAGTRGVGYSRANLFGGYFENYSELAQSPLVIAMIESKKGLDNLDEIISVSGLDAILIGTYDLSASLGKIGSFDDAIVKDSIDKIKKRCLARKIAIGIHIVNPTTLELESRINEGFTFIAYSVDSVMLRLTAELPLKFKSTDS